MNPVINVLIQSGFSGTALQRTLVHEGSHRERRLGLRTFLGSRQYELRRSQELTIYATEFKAYQLETLVDMTTPRPLRGQLPAQAGAAH
jgi:hypothetical protein